MSHPVAIAMGADPGSPAGAEQRRRLAAEAMVVTLACGVVERDGDLAPLTAWSACRAWLRDPTADATEACRRWLPLLEETSSDFPSAAADVLREATRWLLGTILFTRVGPSYVASVAVTCRGLRRLATLRREHAAPCGETAARRWAAAQYGRALKHLTEGAP